MTTGDGSGRSAAASAVTPTQPDLEEDGHNPEGSPPLSVEAPSPADPRTDWYVRVGRRSTVETEVEEPGLPPPTWLAAELGNGHVTLRWAVVPGAIGYLVHRASSPDGPFAIVDHGSGDLLSVPQLAYADTTGTPGEEAWYAVSSLASVEQGTGPLSTVVSATPGTDRGGCVTVAVDARSRAGPLRRPWRPMIGSERLALLERGTGVGGRRVGEEVATALRMAREELGVRAVRAHAILHDELGVVVGSDGAVRYDFGRVDALYDRLLGLGLRPVVELSFMPRALAANPEATIFQYGAIVSTPASLAGWSDLVRALASHLVARYGIGEVSGWAFEVWNEPNLEVFWTGSQADYLDFYEVSARAVKSVDPRLRVGGPATAAAGWIGPLLDRVAQSSAPLDFLATHSYGNPPLDLAAFATARGRPELPIWWTEWGVSPRHFAPVNDSLLGAPFVLRSMKIAAELGIEALAYWVISDHFEELGGPTRLFHGGFGLLSVGNLRKPRYWALALLERLGDETLGARLEGDGANGLVEALATMGPAGDLRLLVWNGTLDQSKAAGDAHLDRTVRLELSGLAAESYLVHQFRVDHRHSNIVGAWEEMGGGDWPDDAGWAALRERDRLDEGEPARESTTRDGSLELTFELPMPGVCFLTLEPR